MANLHGQLLQMTDKLLIFNNIYPIKDVCFLLGTSNIITKGATVLILLVQQ